MEGRSRFSSLISIPEYARPINDKWPENQGFRVFSPMHHGTTLSTSHRRGCVPKRVAVGAA